MTTDRFTQDDVGKIYYTADGNRVKLRAIASARQQSGVAIMEYVVERMVLADDESYEYAADVCITRRLFRKPPTAAKAAELAQLQKDIEEAQTTLAALRVEIKKEKDDNAAFLSRCRKYPALRVVLAYLEGNLLDNPCVIRDYNGWRIQPLRDALTITSSYSKYERGMKLITLFGDTNGNLQWRVNTYADGSGSFYEIELCDSTEAATAFVEEQVRAKIADDLESGRHASAAVVAAANPGIALPEQLEALAAYKYRHMQAQLAQKAEAVTKARDEFDKFKEELQRLTTGETNGENEHGDSVVETL